MNKSKTKNLLILLCACLALFAFITASYIAVSADSADAKLTLSVELQEEYEQGYRFTAPEGTISVSGNSVKATSVLKYPDGSITANKTVTLDRIGEYELKYTAVIGNKSYTLSRNFSTYGKLYTMSSSRSSAEYVTDFGYGRSGVSTGTVEGLKVSLAQGDVLRFNQPINVNDATALDKLISLVITPEKLGEPDVERFKVILTDINDSANKITVTAKIDPAAASVVTDKPVNNQQRIYVTAAAGFQPQTGIEFQYTPPKLHANDIYGTIQNSCSLFGTLNGKELSQNVFDLRFDYATRGIHISNANYEADNRVSDLDDSYFYNQLWDGFTTGYVYVSVEAETYNKNSFNFIVTHFAGQTDLSESADLSVNRFNDCVSPTIVIDFDKYENDIPRAVLGYSYKVFDAKAYDAIDGNVPVSIKVFRNYGGSKSEEPIMGGRFTPTIAVEYTIEYTAKDAVNNVTVETVKVSAISQTAAPITITIDDDRVVSGFYGTEIPVAAYSAEGGVSDLTVDITAVNGNVTLDVSNGSFIPLAEGNWSVIYNATDYAGQSKTASYNVAITKGKAAVFSSMPDLPKYLIAGVQNELPEVIALNYVTANGAPVPTAITFTDKDGEHSVSNRRIVPNVAKSGDMVTVKYVAMLNGVENSISAQIPTVKITKNGNVENVSDYFASYNGATVTTVDSGATVSSTIVGGGAEFINPLVAGVFSTRFGIAKNSCDLKVTLKDSEHAEQSVTFTLTDMGKSVDLITEEGIVYHIYSATFGGNDFEFSYENLSRNMTIDMQNGVYVTINKTDNGEAFTGFSSGKVYMSFTFTDSKQSAVTIKSVGNQSLAKNRSDSEPQLYIGDALPVLPSGSKVRIVPAYAADVFDPVCSFSMTVNKSGNSAAIKDVNGLTLDRVNPTVGYEIILSDVGTYNVQFYAEDQHGNKISSRGSGYVLNSIDDVAPVITVSAPQTSVKVGEMVRLAAAKATDNQDGEVIVRVLLIDAKGIAVLIGDAYDGFVANTAGTYTVMYFADDSTGNRAYVSFTIEAKE